MKHCKHCNSVLPADKRGLACNTCRNGLNRYGLTKLDQIKLYEKQNNQCALCKEDLIMFSKYDGGYIDHCHTTNKVRGILCHPCNTTLGYLENKKLNLIVLQDYLKVS